MQVGFAKTEIPCFIPGIGMMGYGQPHNIVKEVATPLYARAVIFQNTSQSAFIFINVELAFVSIAVKEEVTNRLSAHFPHWNLTMANILMCSQHTHSAPGGYTHYPFYNFTIPDFRTKIFEAVVSSVVEAVLMASKTIAPSVLKLGSHSISPDKEVAFNRSLKAYLNNPEVKKLDLDESHLAVNRQMQGLNIYDQNGKLRVHFNWFGVHATSISSFNQRIHHDNKGVAASLIEKKNHGAMAIFAQAAAGDVSPNYIWDKKLKRMRGKFSNQYENAHYNGELQANASELIKEHLIVEGEVTCHHLYHDITKRAAFPAHGVSFFEGTLEGPGIPRTLGFILRILSQSLKTSKLLFASDKNKSFYEAQGQKDILLDHRTGEFIGIPLSLWKKLPHIPDPVVGNFIKAAKKNSIDTLPWIPPILPSQIIKLGNIFLIGVPGEITTQAAERLKLALETELKTKEIIICSYANAYMGYITTPEEYDLQYYEGGHTVYGRNTLEAIIYSFIELAKSIQQKNIITDLPSFIYPPKELARRTNEQ